jgi:hypothetical protein
MSHDEPRLDLSRQDRVRRFTQEDMLASGIRMALSAIGPVGSIFGEFLTNFVPNQHADRLQDFVEQIHERMQGLEEAFAARLKESAAYAALAERASLAAVQTASAERRRDLATLLKTGLSKSETELIEHEALLRLREQINDAQVIILTMQGLRRTSTHGDPTVPNFVKRHSETIPRQPYMNADAQEQRRWTMYLHYQEALESLGLLRGTEGMVKSEGPPNYAITALGMFLLDAIERSTKP